MNECVDWTESVGAYTDLYNETETTTWVGPAPEYASTNGAGYGYNGSCPEGNWPPEGKCDMTGPEEQYEEVCRLAPSGLLLALLLLTGGWSARTVQVQDPQSRDYQRPRRVRRRGEPPRYRCRLGCILLKMAARSLLTGAALPLLHLPHRARAASSAEHHLAALRLHRNLRGRRLPVPPPDLPRKPRLRSTEPYS